MRCSFLDSVPAPAVTVVVTIAPLYVVGGLSYLCKRGLIGESVFLATRKARLLTAGTLCIASLATRLWFRQEGQTPDSLHQVQIDGREFDLKELAYLSCLNEQEFQQQAGKQGLKDRTTILNLVQDRYEEIKRRSHQDKIPEQLLALADKLEGLSTEQALPALTDGLHRLPSWARAHVLHWPLPPNPEGHPPNGLFWNERSQDYTLAPCLTAARLPEDFSLLLVHWLKKFANNLLDSIAHGATGRFIPESRENLLNVEDSTPICYAALSASEEGGPFVPDIHFCRVRRSSGEVGDWGFDIKEVCHLVSWSDQQFQRSGLGLGRQDVEDVFDRRNALIKELSAFHAIPQRLRELKAKLKGRKDADPVSLAAYFDEEIRLFPQWAQDHIFAWPIQTEEEEDGPAWDAVYEGLRLGLALKHAQRMTDFSEVLIWLVKTHADELQRQPIYSLENSTDSFGEEEGEDEAVMILNHFMDTAMQLPTESDSDGNSDGSSSESD